MNKMKLRAMIVESLEKQIRETSTKVSQKVRTQMNLKPVDTALTTIKSTVEKVPDAMKAKIIAKMLKTIGISDEDSFKKMRTRIQAILRKGEKSEEAGVDTAPGATPAGTPTSIPTREHLERIINEEMEALIR